MAGVIAAVVAHYAGKLRRLPLLPPSAMASLRPQPPPRQRVLTLTLPAEQWLSVSRFQKPGQHQTLDMVEQSVTLAMRHFQTFGGKRPTVVLDLDDTLFVSNQTRSYRIIHMWLDARPELDQHIRRSLSTMKPPTLAYSLRDTFEKVGGLDLTDPVVAAALTDLQSYWTPRFFSNELVVDDPVQYGAAKFASRLHDLGANIAYVTGRDEQRMGVGTREAIAKSELPQLSSPRVKLFLKPNKDVVDADFKKSVVGKLDAWGHVVATFDNAPANCVVFAKAFAHAMNVFVDTVYDSAPVEVRDGLYRIFDFGRRRRST